MFIITGVGKDKEGGAFSVLNEDGEKVLYMFEEEDDAVRYSLQLEEMGFLSLEVIEIDDELMLKTCEYHGHSYTIITDDDIVIPPELYE